MSPNMHFFLPRNGTTKTVSASPSTLLLRFRASQLPIAMVFGVVYLDQARRAVRRLAQFADRQRSISLSASKLHTWACIVNEIAVDLESSSCSSRHLCSCWFFRRMYFKRSFALEMFRTAGFRVLSSPFPASSQQHVSLYAPAFISRAILLSIRISVPTP